MGDQDFNFPPSERREPKRFEPPPWEQGAFEEFSRVREAEERAAQEAAAAEAAAAAAAEAPPAGEAAEAAVAPGPEPGSPAMPDGGGAQEVRPGGAAAPGAVVASGQSGPGALDDARVTELMAGLRAEEPTSMQTYGAIAIALSVFTGMVGVVMLVWAMAMFVSATARGTGRVGVISGSIVAFFGALFIGLSIWVAVRTLRQRGVL